MGAPLTGIVGYCDDSYRLCPATVASKASRVLAASSPSSVQRRKSTIVLVDAGLVMGEVWSPPRMVTNPLGQVSLS